MLCSHRDLTAMTYQSFLVEDLLDEGGSGWPVSHGTQTLFVHRHRPLLGVFLIGTKRNKQEMK